MARHLILRSWLLPWQEKRLLVISVLLTAALYSTEFLANSLGLAVNPRELNSGIKPILGFPLIEFIDAIIYTFFGAISVSIAQRSMNEQEVNFNQIAANLCQRIGALLAFALLVQLLFFVIGISWIRLRTNQSPWLFHEYILFSLLWLLLGKTPFILALPTIINEKGRFHQLLHKSWRAISAPLPALSCAAFLAFYSLWRCCWLQGSS